ncbi:glycosyltransferase [Caballeronia sp. LZ035]|uniref:glycosyltransferase n=1 Tax=Caballeronia sp. LZ035 TaxID=3038568 RepID=UPI00286332B0|nr:glycosyltransferase [Caballeronia sp. LZ035]MDR5759815.1 glycosyltransferase [Caballeronia sp. LZ035]
MRTRIMFVITGLNLGGAESQLLLLVRALQRLGWEVAVVSMIEPKYFVQDFAEMGVEVITLKMLPGKSDPRALWRFAKLVRSWRPDIVHSHMVHANIFVRVARLFFPTIPIVSTAHSINELEGSYARLLAYRLTRHLSHYTSSVSASSYQHYVSLRMISPRKGGFVPNGVDLERFDCDADARAALRVALGIEDQFVWLAVGRLVPAKDFSNLIKAVALLRDQGLSRMRVLLAGDGPEKADLLKQCEQAGLGPIIQFLGPRHDIPDLMNAADAVVLSSAWEGMPMVILEAMAARRTVVATHVGGVGELFPADDVDKLARPKDPVALAERMAYTMRLSAEEHEQAGQRGRAFVERSFDIRKVARDWDALYHRLANSASTREAAVQAGLHTGSEEARD